MPYSVVDRHRLTPIRILISKLMPTQIQIRIDIKTMPNLLRFLPQVLHVLENKKTIFTFGRSFASLQCFIFTSVSKVS